MARLASIMVYVFLLGLFVFSATHCGPKNVIVCFDTKDCPATGNYVCSRGICTVLDGGSVTDGGQEGDGGNSEGTVDLSGPCDTGQRRSCYTGPSGTLNKGGCRAGEQLCVDGKWGNCVGENLPTAEICDGKDNDCNGLIDETCQCTPGEAQGCYTGPRGTQGQGICKAGTRICLVTRTWGPCEEQTLPSEELCDGKDNDCNGQIDEGCVKCTVGEKRACYTGPAATQGKGICKPGQQTCDAAGKWSACVGEILPAFEYCDKIDNDCNGQIDDDCKDCIPGKWRECYTDIPGIPAAQQPCVNQAGKWVCKGVCYTGRQYCSDGGKWLDCVGMLLPRAEDCNGKDDDCNGQIDENLSPPLCNPAGVGACAGAVKKCSGAQGWLPCTLDDYQQQNRDYEKIETKCDGKDNDCNGKIDEPCTNLCQTGQKRKCYDGVAGSQGKGICKEGEQTCGADKRWGACTAQVLPRAEVCNGIDDDCDGFIDESFPEQGQPCQTGKPGICDTGFYACQGGKLACPPSYAPRTEICNGRDDDCNGKIDDGAAQYTFYRDADGDGFGDPTKPIQACAAPPGYVANAKDCYDNNAAVHPNQFAFFTTHRGDGSFDYNCDGQQQPRYTQLGSCKDCKSAVIDIGFLAPIPACGKTGKWVDQCRFDVGQCYPLTIDKVQECR